jgi:hypothetical protein
VNFAADDLSPIPMATRSSSSGTPAPSTEPNSRVTTGLVPLSATPGPAAMPVRSVLWLDD